MNEGALRGKPHASSARVTAGDDISRPRRGSLRANARASIAILAYGELGAKISGQRHKRKHAIALGIQNDPEGGGRDSRRDPRPEISRRDSRSPAIEDQTCAAAAGMLSPSGERAIATRSKPRKRLAPFLRMANWPVANISPAISD